MIGDADDRAAFLGKDVLQFGERKLAVGICAVDVKSGFQHAEILIAGFVPRLAGRN